MARRAVALGVIAASLIVAGCGSQSISYSQDAVASCISDSAILEMPLATLESQTATEAVADTRDIATARDLNANLPGGFAAKLDSGELLIFYVGTTPRDAEIAGQWFDSRKSADSSAVARRYGNLLVIAPGSVNVGAAKVVDDCRHSAQKT